MASSLVRTEYIEVDSGRIAFDDTGGPGHIVLCIPVDGRSAIRISAPRARPKAGRIPRRHDGCAGIRRNVSAMD